MHRHSLIIGGTRGIGRELLQIFSAQGHAVSVIGKRAPAEGDRKLPGASFWMVDISDKPARYAAILEIIQKNGPINNLVFLQRFKADGDKWAGELEMSLTATKEIIEQLSTQFAATAT